MLRQAGRNLQRTREAGTPAFECLPCCLCLSLLPRTLAACYVLCIHSVGIVQALQHCRRPSERRRLLAARADVLKHLGLAGLARQDRARVHATFTQSKCRGRLHEHVQLFECGDSGGRGLRVAPGATLQPGDRIIEERPLAAVLLPQERERRCHYCLQSLFVANPHSGTVNVLCT